MEHHEAVRTMAVERYLLDEMADDAREVFEAHFFECGVCAEAVRTGSALADATRAGLVPAAAPAVPAARPRWSPFPGVAMAAAAALALVVGYQTFVTIPGLQTRLEAPRALAPVALAPTSRGDGPVIAVPDRDASIALALDINVDPGDTQLVYDLRSDAGVVLLTGQAPVPLPGTPLLLLLPGSSLTDGQFVIIVRSGASPAREVGTYRFTAK